MALRPGAGEGVLAAAGIAAIALSIASVALVPLAIARLPEDHFSPDPDAASGSAPVRTARLVALRVARNVLGALLALAGVAMLFLPGQGILTLLVGLALTDVPGKRSLELALARRPKILSTMNWIRARAGRPPFRPPE